MGRGGDDSIHQKPSLDSEVEPALLRDPPFSVKQLRDAIPAHCFVRSNFKSFCWLAHDVVLIIASFYLASFIDHSSVPSFLRYVLWPIYWFIQGLFFTGLWVVAHECGHRGFSASDAVNDGVGLVAHSFLVVPYHSWRISHAKHHKYTANMELDEVFVPGTRSAFTSDPSDKTPLGNLIAITFMLTIGWPAYLLRNVTGRPYPRPANHFYPSSPIFLPSEASYVVISNIALFIMFISLGSCAYLVGVGAVVKFYGIPYLWVNFWLVLITFLQHTDLYVPHFRGADWNWLRGALCTVDRSYGSILNHLFHHISDTHVCHHLFSKIPHYHAQEATEALKPLLGRYYLQDETPIAVALWRAFCNCRFVEDVGSILFYKRSLNDETNQNKPQMCGPPTQQHPAVSVRKSGKSNKCN